MLLNQLADFVAAIDPKVVPENVQALVSQHILDVIAGVFAGAQVSEAEGVGAVIGGGNAALGGRMAMMAHAAESDPIHAPTTLCAGMIAVPPALVFSTNGATAVAAVLAGYEVAIRIGLGVKSSKLIERGWWPTAVIGGAGSAAATARALGLSAAETRNAIALALVQAGGLGGGAAQAPESRNLLAANCVRTGIEAAFAARHGLSGPPEVLTGARGFVAAFGLDLAPEAIHDEAGRKWMIEDTSLKAFPCALQAQTALAALQSLIDGEDLSAGSIRALTIEQPEAMRRIVDHTGMPQSHFAAAANLRFLAAVMAHDGDIALDRMGETGRRDPEIRAFMEKITLLHDPALDADYPASWPARVRIETDDGERQAMANIAPGHPDAPIGMEVTEERLRSFAEGALPPKAREDVIKAVRDIAALENLGQLTGPILKII